MKYDHLKQKQQSKLSKPYQNAWVRKADYHFLIINWRNEDQKAPFYFFRIPKSLRSKRHQKH